MSDANRTTLTFELSMSVYAHAEGFSKKKTHKERVLLQDPKVIHSFIHNVNNLHIPAIEATKGMKKRLFNEEESDNKVKSAKKSRKSAPPLCLISTPGNAMHAVDRVLEERIALLHEINNLYRSRRDMQVLEPANTCSMDARKKCLDGNTVSATSYSIDDVSKCGTKGTVTYSPTSPKYTPTSPCSRLSWSPATSLKFEATTPCSSVGCSPAYSYSDAVETASI